MLLASLSNVLIPLLAAVEGKPWINELWYVLPLVVVISLVYSGTRYEQPDDILIGSLHSAKWIVGFMLIVFAVLWFVSWLAT